MAAAETARLIASLELQDKNFTRGLKQRRARRRPRRQEARRVRRCVNRNVARGIDTLITQAASTRVGAVIRRPSSRSRRSPASARRSMATSTASSTTSRSCPPRPARRSRSWPASPRLGGAMGIAKEDIAAFTEQVAILGATTNVSHRGRRHRARPAENRHRPDRRRVRQLRGDRSLTSATRAIAPRRKSSRSPSARVPQPRLIGIAKDETLGWASAAANLGLGEELAGTALQKFFVDTQKIIARGGKDLKTLAKISRHDRQAVQEGVREGRDRRAARRSSRASRNCPRSSACSPSRTCSARAQA